MDTIRSQTPQPRPPKGGAGGLKLLLEHRRSNGGGLRHRRLGGLHQLLEKKGPYAWRILLPMAEKNIISFVHDFPPLYIYILGQLTFT